MATGPIIRPAPDHVPRHAPSIIGHSRVLTAFSDGPAKHLPQVGEERRQHQQGCRLKRGHD
jgi:hypothetical protein